MASNVFDALQKGLQYCGDCERRLISNRVIMILQFAALQSGKSGRRNFNAVCKIFFGPCILVFRRLKQNSFI